MRLPDFLIIGAMKSGTTTLFADLQTHPGVFFPLEKEPMDLTSDDVLTDRGRRRYASLFAAAGDDQICGEASTASTKRPVYEGVPRRARSVLGDDLRIIYITRNPVERSLSHHRFLYGRDELPQSLVEALASHPEIIDFSRYDYQAAAWLEEFTSDRLWVVALEDYVANRNERFAEMCQFLGLDPSAASPGGTANRSDQMAVPIPILRRFLRTNFYLRVVKRMVPPGGRAVLRRWLRRAPDKPAVIVEPEAVAMIRRGVADDAEQFIKRFGLPEQIWQLGDLNLGRILEPETSPPESIVLRHQKGGAGK